MDQGNYESHFHYASSQSDSFTNPVQDGSKNCPTIPAYPTYFAADYPTPPANDSRMENQNYHSDIPIPTDSSFNNQREVCGIDQSEVYSYNTASYSQSTATTTTLTDDYQQHQPYNTYPSSTENPASVPTQYSNYSNQVPPQYANQGNQIPLQYGHQSNQCGNQSIHRLCDQLTSETFHEPPCRYIHTDTNSPINTSPVNTASNSMILTDQQSVNEEDIMNQCSDVFNKNTNSDEQLSSAVENTYQSNTHVVTLNHSKERHAPSQNDVNHHLEHINHNVLTSDPAKPTQQVARAELENEMHEQLMAVGKQIASHHYKEEDMQQDMNINHTTLHIATNIPEVKIDKLDMIATVNANTALETDNELLNVEKAVYTPLSTGKDGFGTCSIIKSQDNKLYNIAEKTNATNQSGNSETSSPTKNNFPLALPTKSTFPLTTPIRNSFPLVSPTRSNFPLQDTEPELPDMMSIIMKRRLGGKDKQISSAAEKQRKLVIYEVEDTDIKITTLNDAEKQRKLVNNDEAEMKKESTKEAENRRELINNEVEYKEIKIGTANAESVPAKKRMKLENYEVPVVYEDNKVANPSDFESKFVDPVPTTGNESRSNEMVCDSAKEDILFAPKSVSDPSQSVLDIKATVNTKAPDNFDSDSSISQDNEFVISCFQSLQGANSDENTNTSDFDSESSKIDNIENFKTVESSSIAENTDSSYSSNAESECSKIVDPERCVAAALNVEKLGSSNDVLELSKIAKRNPAILVGTEEHVDANRDDDYVNPDSRMLSQTTNIQDTTADLPLLKNQPENSKPSTPVPVNQDDIFVHDIEANTKAEHSHSSGLSVNLVADAETNTNAGFEDHITEPGDLPGVLNENSTDAATKFEDLMSEHSQSSEPGEVAPSDRVQASSRRTIEAVISSVRPVAVTNEGSHDGDTHLQTVADEVKDQLLISTVDKSRGKLVVKIVKRKAIESEELPTSPEHKKSRKQHMPKRVYRTIPVPNSCSSTESSGITIPVPNRHCSTESSEISQSNSEEDSTVPYNENNIQLEPKHIAKVLKTKSDKPRKQTIPKRFVDSETALHEGSITKPQVASGKPGKKSKSEKKRKQIIPKRFNDFAEVNEDEIDGYVAHSEIRRSKSVARDNYLNSEMAPHYSKYFELNRAMELLGGNIEGASVDPDSELTEGADLKIPPAPVQGGVVENLMKSVYQHDQGEPVEPETSGNKTNFDANLDIVRKLREIRFNRYRKISISEKKTVAAYAKIHGVSAAANHHGVSKSAVSLWTRTEFKESDEDLEKRRRNCMLGNENFESLIKRVKNEKSRKFKGLCKEDKYEVSKYAKLVGVREMSRCLDIALGTVSGWMRQYPYMITPNNEAEANQVSLDMSCDSIGESTAIRLDKTNMELIKPENIKKEAVERKSIIVQNEADSQENTSIKQECSEASESYGLSQVAALNTENKDNLESQNNIGKVKTEPASEIAVRSKDMNGYIKTELNYEMDKNNDVGANITEKGNDENNMTTFGNQFPSEKNNYGSPKFKNVEKEVEQLIAQSYIPPDVDKCWEDIQDQITGTLLENDTFFESLFRRLTMCRVDKYKTLKASEKLEIVRYAKRVGVRRIAKVMDLATGTLSGWINRYQNHLGLTMCEGIDSEQNTASITDTGMNLGMDSSIDLGQNSPSLSDSFSNPSLGSTPSVLSRSSSILDNEEKGEVTALKFLLKDQFSVLGDKITIAKTMKFRNMTPADKVEIVKCAKLVGIRPTARVFSMPIGTLSGWITKYSRILEPEFQGNGQGGGMMMDLSVTNQSETSDSANVSEHLSHSNTPLIGADPVSQSDEDSEPAPSAYSQMMEEFARSNKREPTEDSPKQVPLRRARISWPKIDSVGNGDDSNLTQFLPSVKLPNGYESSILESSFNAVSQASEASDFNQQSTFISQSTRTEEAFAQQYMQQAYKQHGVFPHVAFSQ